MTKRILSLLLAALTVFSLCAPALASGEPTEDIPAIEMPAEPKAAAQAEPLDEPEVTALSGTCGANGSTSVKWKLTANGTDKYGRTTYTITISGNGRMEDFYAAEGVAMTPWVYYKNNITKVIVQSGVTSIGDNAFYLAGQTYGPSSVTLPDTLTEIGESAFAYLAGLQSITIPDSVRSIGEFAFWGTDLRSIKLPSSLTAISYQMLCECKYLSSVVIPKGVTSIADLAFCGCKRLTSVTIPDSVTSIGESAFVDCGSLTSVTIPRSVKEIGCGAFDECGSLTTVTVLNPACVISYSSSQYHNDTLGEPGTATVRGYSGSTAEKYAKAHGYAFKSLGAAPSDKKGWVTEGGKRYYYQNGAKLKGLYIIGGAKYYFSSKDGHMLTGLVRVDSKGHICYFSAKTGKMLTGIVTVDSKGHKCYFSAKTGYRLTGLVTVDNAGHKCYFSAKTGYRLTGLVTTDSKGTQRYFSVKTGYMMKNGWYNIGGGRKVLIDASGVVTKTAKI